MAATIATIATITTMSTEQIAVINRLKEGRNVICEARAGSGKTTTIFHMCQQLASKRIFILTYNARLKKETQEKVRDLDWVVAENYHSAACKLFRPHSFTDAHIDEILTDDAPLLPHKSLSFDILVVDEAQDMTRIYYEFVKKLIRTNAKKTNIQIVLFGDSRQRIYECFGADERYLTRADAIFARWSNRPSWRRQTLSTSYRITHPIAKQVNSLMNCSNGEFIRSIRNGPMVRHFIINPFYPENPANIIKTFLGAGYKPDDIFVLAASAKSLCRQSPLTLLENWLVYDGIPCYYSQTDSEEIDEKTTKGKIIFSSFHQVKGLERAVVIVYDFDDKYLLKTNQNLNEPEKIECPNAIYVAITRAKEHLVLIHGHLNGYFPFHDLSDRSSYVTEIGTMVQKKANSQCSSQNNSPTNQKQNNPYIWPVTRLVSGLSWEAEKRISAFIESAEIEPKGISIAMKSAICCNRLHEPVSAITGIAVPALYHYSKTKRCHLLDTVLENADRFRPHHQKRLATIASTISADNASSSLLSRQDILYIANLYRHIENGYRSSLEQIPYSHSTWLNGLNLDPIMQVAERHLGSPNVICAYEQSIANEKVSGVVDFITENVNHSKKTVWEIKCTKEISQEHIRQLAVYAALMGDQYQYKLLNLLTGQIVEVSWTDSLTEMVDALIAEKRDQRVALSDEEFVEQHSL